MILWRGDVAFRTEVWLVSCEHWRKHLPRVDIAVRIDEWQEVAYSGRPLSYFISKRFYEKKYSSLPLFIWSHGSRWMCRYPFQD